MENRLIKIFIFFYKKNIDKLFKMLYNHFCEEI